MGSSGWIKQSFSPKNVAIAFCHIIQTLNMLLNQPDNTIARDNLMQHSRLLPEPKFVGRAKELNELQHFLKEALLGRGSTVFVAGEAGSGKTRLAKELLDEARTQGFLVFTGFCLSHVSAPYFPFIEALGPILQKKVAESNIEISGAIEIYEPLHFEYQKDYSFTAIIHKLFSLMANKPAILFIEDIHWADSASLSLLHYLSRSIDKEPITILATYRTEEIVSNVSHQNHLRETLRLMGREKLFSQINLSPLNTQDISILAQSMLGGKIRKSFAKQLSNQTNGNALFAVEAIRTMYNLGHLSKVKGEWNSGQNQTAFPTVYRDVILRRIESLEPIDRRILDVGSVVGTKFNPKLVAAALSMDFVEVLNALDNISKSSNLIANQDSIYQFNHSKTREMLYQEISQPLKLEYNLRIADELEKEKSIDVSTLAHHLQQAKSKERAVRYSLEAGKVALGNFSNLEAIDFFKYVHKNVQPNSHEFIDAL